MRPPEWTSPTGSRPRERPPRELLLPAAARRQPQEAGTRERVASSCPSLGRPTGAALSMNLDDVTRRGKSRLLRYAGQPGQKVGRDVFFDCATVAADGENRITVMPVALARDEGVERFDSMRLPALGQSRQRAVDRWRCQTRVLVPQASEHLVGGHRHPVASQDSQHLRLHSLSALGHGSLAADGGRIRNVTL